MRIVLALVALLALAGCVTPDPAQIEAAAVSDPLAPPTPRVMEFAFDGAFAASVIACPVVTCVAAGGTDTWQALDIDTNLTGVSLTMTWDAATPAMAELRLGMGWGPEDDRSWELVDGPSPLVLDVTGLDIPATDDPYVFAWVPCAVPMCAVIPTAPQDFHVEGTLTVE